MLMQTALVALGATLAAAVQPLEVKDNYFVNPKTGNRFQVVGVAYQPGGASGFSKENKRDPLSDKDVCLRDAALMQVLGVNTLRVYNLDPDLNHDECASIFNAAGMYMLLDVNAPGPGEAISSFEPWTTYYDTYLNRTFAVIEGFKDYPNTLGFFSGNEVINTIENGATVPPYIRAVTRDLKSYIKKHASRPIPVGYSAADVRDVLFDTYRYLQCHMDDEDEDLSHADMFALNSYSWCGNSDFHTSSYDDLVAGFKGSSVPVFFSEFGCNDPAPRIFSEIGTIYGDKMSDVFSGGIVYEFAQEVNNFGLVNLNEDNTAELLQDFNTLRNQYAKLDFNKLQSTKPSGDASPKAVKCDPSIITTKGFNNNFTLPVLPPNTDTILNNGVNPAPKGKLVNIDGWTVTHSVKDVTGSTISNLAVKPLADDATNAPGSNTNGGNAGPSTNATSNGTSTTPSSSTSTSKNGAPMATAFIAAPAAMFMAAAALL